jgi:ubiquitin carboxyl-terminal hydrolase 12/46
MGGTESKLQKELGPTQDKDDSKYFGLQNFGNTCYANSILQVLFYCHPLREYLLKLAQQHDLQNHQWETEEGILFALCDLFQQLDACEGSLTMNKKRGTGIAPKQFIQKLRKESPMFSTLMHQDAQEFWSYLVNSCVETLQKKMKEDSLTPSTPRSGTDKQISNNNNDGISIEPDQENTTSEKKPIRTFLHNLFEGEFTTETRCITCEISSQRTEKFLELSLDVVQNTSLSHCLHRFSEPETLRGNNKFFCETCCSLQEAQKRSNISKWPRVLCLHLKRFKYHEQIGQHLKLPYRIVFPMELRTPTDRVLSLFGIIIHVGSGPNSGHYKSIVKNDNRWIMFDDDVVTIENEAFVRSLFGCPGEHVGINDTGYMLFYMDEGSDWNDLSDTTPQAENQMDISSTNSD